MIFQPSDRPLQVTILIPPEASLMSLAATLDPMRAANRILGAEAYRWRVLSLDGRPVATSCGLPVGVDGALDAAGTARLRAVRPDAARFHRTDYVDAAE